MANDNYTPRFTAPNIAAVLRAIPETDGTYQDVIRQVSEYGVALSPARAGFHPKPRQAGSSSTRFPCTRRVPPDLLGRSETLCLGSLHAQGNHNTGVPAQRTPGVK